MIMPVLSTEVVDPSGDAARRPSDPSNRRSNAGQPLERLAEPTPSPSRPDDHNPAAPALSSLRNAGEIVAVLAQMALAHL